jgi:aerobic carbon-monoxide dehydrogenase medium subunit
VVGTNEVAYCRPATLGQALDVLTAHGSDAKILAGGQSLVPMMSAGFVTAELLVDINGLPGLDSVAVADGEIRVGALARHRALELAGPELAAAAPLLPAAAPLIAHVPIRNRGTFAGSLVHADPAAEWPAVALAAGATIVLASSRGERAVPAAEFFLGPLMADIEPDEIVVEVRLPAAPRRTGAAVRELTYRAGDYAIVGVVAQVSLGEDGQVCDCRVALFGVDATPVRVPEAEAATVTGGIDEATALAAAAAHPQSDATASAGYRQEMIGVFCRRALLAARDAAGSPARR